MSISLNNWTVLVLVNGKKFELTRTRTRNSNSTWLETLTVPLTWSVEHEIHGSSGRRNRVLQAQKVHPASKCAAEHNFIVDKAGFWSPHNIGCQL